MALGPRAKLQLGILISTITVRKFRENILETSRNVREYSGDKSRLVVYAENLFFTTIALT